MTSWSYRGDFYIAQTLDRIDRKVDTIMANLSALQAAAQQVGDDVASAISRLDELSDKVRNGDTVSQADVDAITASLQSAHENLTTAVASDDPIPGNDAPAADAGPVAADSGPTDAAPADAGDAGTTPPPADGTSQP